MDIHPFLLSYELTLTKLTVLGMNHPDERVALQAVEFWSTVCEEEIELAIEAAEVSSFDLCPARILDILYE